jgi:hypothetical protein
MNLDIPIPTDLLYKFNGIKFHDDIHKYYLGDKNLISVTTLLHEYQEPFNEQYWSEIKAVEYGMTSQGVITMWKAGNDKSKIKGSIIHNYAELLYNNKVFKYPAEEVLKKLGEDTIKPEYDIVKGYVDNFYRDSFNKLIPIKTEFVVYDELWGLAGMMDILFWNVKHKCFQIYDWKTNKEFTMTNEYSQKLKYPLSKLDDSHINIYSLQLSAYKSILMRNTGIIIEGMYVVWFNEINENYKVIECIDYSKILPRLIGNI